MLQLKFRDLKKETSSTVVIPVCEDKNIHSDRTLLALIKKACRLDEFSGKKDEKVIFYNPRQVKAQRLIFLGTGKLEKINLESLRQLAGAAVNECIRKDLPEAWFAVPAAEKLDMEPSAALEALMEGACLGNHRFNKYKEEQKHKPLKKIHFLVKPDAAVKYRKLASRVETVCKGTILAREWVSTPSNDKLPEQFSRSIVGLAKKEKLTFHVMNEKDLKQKKFGSLLAVAAGSRNKPRMVVLEYKPRGAAKTVALIGKGVTFDSGGINLKTSSSLTDMKMDMSGAAAVAATLITIARIKPKVKVIGVIPIVENMPSGNATRPGDIVRSYQGKTVEIGNTDAEGRLILIDAMAYAVKKYKPQAIIDVATLTGACIMALGEKIAGLFSSDEKLADAIVQAGEKTHERCWRLPLPEDYKPQLKSEFADLSNMGNTRWGGAITAALFLSEFTGDTPWAHLDIAGPAYVKKENAYCPVGGTGFGVRLLCDVIEKLSINFKLGEKK